MPTVPRLVPETATRRRIQIWDRTERLESMYYTVNGGHDLQYICDIRVHAIWSWHYLKDGGGGLRVEQPWCLEGHANFSIQVLIMSFINLLDTIYVSIWTGLSSPLFPQPLQNIQLIMILKLVIPETPPRRSPAKKTRSTLYKGYEVKKKDVKHLYKKETRFPSPD